MKTVKLMFAFLVMAFASSTVSAQTDFELSKVEIIATGKTTRTLNVEIAEPTATNAKPIRKIDRYLRARLSRTSISKIVSRQTAGNGGPLSFTETYTTADPNEKVVDVEIELFENDKLVFKTTRKGVIVK